MKKNFSFLQLKTLLFQPFCSFFAIAFFGLLLVGLSLVFTNRKQPLFSQSPEPQNLAIQSDLNQKSRTKRASNERSEEAPTECHITRHDAVYKNLWTHLFKVVFPWLKAEKITKVWVLTDVSLRPYLQKEFNVAAFNYHGVEEYRSWEEIPAEVKCNWFNKYPNIPRENPWLSAPFLTLRGLYFYLGVLGDRRITGTGYSFLTLYKYWKVTKFFNLFDIGHFLTLSDRKIFQSLSTNQFSHIKDPQDFLYALGLFLLNAANVQFPDWLATKHRDKHQLVTSSYQWQMFNVGGRKIAKLKSQLRGGIQHLNLYYQTRSLFWELDHYQENQLDDVLFSNLNKESKIAVSYYDLSQKAKEELQALLKITSSSNLRKFKQPLEALVQKAKAQLFWKIIRTFQPQLQKVGVTSWKGVGLNPLLTDSLPADFIALPKPAQATLLRLIAKFYPLITNPSAQIASLKKFHQYDSYQEIGQLSNQLNSLLIAKSGTSVCLAISDSRYQQWWEEVLQPLVPKLIEHKVTTVYYGVKRATFYKDSTKWQIGDWLSADRLFFNVAANNYYGAKEYSNYQAVPNTIKCQLPSFLFQPNRVKTLKSLKIYLDVLLPRLANYKKHPPDKYGEWKYADQFSITQLLTKSEQEIFTFIKAKNWGSQVWQNAFNYLAVLDISKKIRSDYLQRVDRYFTNSQFWLDTRSSWEKMRNDQFLTDWKGSIVTSLKTQADTAFYQQLPINVQTILETLLKTTNSHLLVTQIKALAHHLSQLDALWTQLQTFQSDLEKYQMKQLQAVDFTHLRSHLTVANPRELPSQAKAELINLMEIADLVEQFKQSLIWLGTRSAWQKIVNDQLLTSWRGYDITGLKKEANLASYHQLNPANQIVLKNLMETDSSQLLIAQITTLTNHLSQLDVLWKELQTLRSDLEKYPIDQLETVEFSNLKAHLATSDPAELPPQAKAELLNLLEIDDFVVKLKESLTSFRTTDVEKTADNQTLIIVLSTVLPLVVFGLVGGAFFYFKKKSKAGSPKPKK